MIKVIKNESLSLDDIKDAKLGTYISVDNKSYSKVKKGLWQQDTTSVHGIGATYSDSQMYNLIKDKNAKLNESKVILKDISDSWNMIDKYNIDYNYSRGNNYIEISDSDYKKMLDNSKNKKYIMNLRLNKQNESRYTDEDYEDDLPFDSADYPEELIDQDEEDELEFQRTHDGMTRSEYNQAYDGPYGYIKD